MSKPTDDLDAVRQLTTLLEAFTDEERERIIRWTREKLGMQPQAGVQAPAAGPANPTASPLPPPGAVTATDVKSFMAQKDPKSERQLAATVAYYYRFVAPEAQRKESIGADDLIGACRQADRGRPKNPAQTLVNAFHDGYLDRGDRGQYQINSVGENLVAMVLPGEPATARASRQAAKKGKRPARASGTSRKRR